MKRIKCFKVIINRLVIFFIVATLIFGLGFMFLYKTNLDNIQFIMAKEDISGFLENQDELLNQLEDSSSSLSEMDLIKGILYSDYVGEEYALSDFDLDKRYQVLTDILKLEDYPFLDIKFFDIKGNLRYSYSHSESGVNEYNIIKSVTAGNHVSGFFINDISHEITAIGSHPILHEGDIIGVVNITRSMDDAVINLLKNSKDIELKIIKLDNILHTSDDKELLSKDYLNSTEGKVVISESILEKLSSSESIYVDWIRFADKKNEVKAYIKLFDYEENQLGLVIITRHIFSVISTYRNIYILGFIVLELVLIFMIYLIVKHLKMLKHSTELLKSDLRGISVDITEFKKLDEIKVHEIYELSEDFERVIKRISRQNLKSIISSDLSSTDELTGFWNHRYFYEMISGEADKGKEFSICLINIDRFKRINSEFSHSIGDKVIRALSEIISENYSEYEFFRYGGEEFAILMKETSVIDAYKYAEEIRKRVEQSSLIRRMITGAQVTITIGISSYSRQANNIDTLVEKAERALEFGKKHGRNQSNIYDNEVEIFFEDSKQNSKAYLSIHDAVESLITTLEEKDTYTGNHSKLVQKYTLLIGERIGMSKKLLENLGVSSILHDIGKIGIPDTILSCTEKLNVEDYSIAMEHTLVGYNIAKRLVHDPNILAGIKSHHERWDGSGYPEGLKDEEIPLFARIIGIADAYQSMIFGSHYRERKTVDEAINDLLENSGTQFDPFLVDVFIDIIKEG